VGCRNFVARGGGIRISGGPFSVVTRGLCNGTSSLALRARENRNVKHHYKLLLVGSSSYFEFPFSCVNTITGWFRILVLGKGFGTSVIVFQFG
jgi:hypothetical protein